MKNLETVIAEHPFFKGLDAASVKIIVDCASNVCFQPETYIFKEGNEADYFYLIRQGQVAIEIFAPERGPITVQTVNEGDVLGWSWLFPPYHWQFDARATKLTRATVFDGRCLRTKCETDNRLGYELIKRFSQIVVDRLQATRMQLLDVYGQSTRG